MPNGADFKYGTGDTDIWRIKYYAAIDYLISVGASVADMDAFLQANSSWSPNPLPLASETRDYVTTTGTATAMTITSATAYVAQPDGLKLRLNLHTALGEAVTLKLDGLTAMPIVYNNGTEALGLTGYVEVISRGGKWEIVALTPPVQDAVPVGHIQLQVSAPSDAWVVADGQALSDTTYPDWKSYFDTDPDGFVINFNTTATDIGKTAMTSTGGNTTVPDLIDVYLGAGSTIGQCLVSQNKSHRHSYSRNQTEKTVQSGSGQPWMFYGGTTSNTGYEGGDQARPNTLILKPWIKVQ